MVKIPNGGRCTDCDLVQGGSIIFVRSEGLVRGDGEQQQNSRQIRYQGRKNTDAEGGYCFIVHDDQAINTEAFGLESHRFDSCQCRPLLNGES